jgi:hypothetical protein
MSKNALIVGCGSKLGLTLAKTLLDREYQIYGITGSDVTDTRIHHQRVDWATIGITECEKFLRALPKIDLVIFNQNSPALTEEYFKYNNIDIFEVWSRSKKWQQSHYVNCVLPAHFLHTLSDAKKINDQSTIIWMLSNVVFDHTGPVDYLGQKSQNLYTMQRFAEHNQQIHLGIDPATLEADILVRFMLAATQENSGKFYSISKTSITERC